jgi:hypothetical protein
MKRHFLARVPVVVLLSMLLCGAVEADQALGLPDVVMDIVDGNEAIVSLTYAGTTYVVANGDLATGTTTRWYIDPATQVETQWVDGDPVPPETVSGTSNPKTGDQGWQADNFTFRVPSWSNDMCSIDGIDFMETIFPFATDIFFILERNGNDAGTIQAIYADDSLGPAVTLANRNPYAATGISVGDQNAYGLVFITDTPVKGLRITASGFDALSISTPAGSDTRQAHDPQPEDEGQGVLVAGATLSWKTGVDPADPNLPNPAITAHFLWLSKAYGPMNPPGAPNWQDPAVQTFTIGADTNPADGNVDPEASHVIAGLQKDSLYFWAVDESLGASGPTDADNIILGGTWTFETEKSGPVVDAGSSIVTWLKAGTTTVDLNGTVTDSTGDVTAIQWSVVASPLGSNVNIANNSVAATTATLTGTGRYVLELHAIDATQQEDSGLIEINVYADSCEAAKNDPNGYTAPPYDFNADCKVDFIDFAMFAEGWLQNGSPTSDILYDAGTISLPPVVQFTNPLNASTVSGEVIINAIAYDPDVGTTDGDGMEGAGGVDFDIIDSSGAVLGSHHENIASFDMTWDTTLPLYPNGVYTIRVTAESDAGYQTIQEISVTVNNP